MRWSSEGCPLMQDVLPMKGNGLLLESMKERYRDQVEHPLPNAVHQLRDPRFLRIALYLQNQLDLHPPYRAST